MIVLKGIQHHFLCYLFFVFSFHVVQGSDSKMNLCFLVVFDLLTAPSGCLLAALCALVSLDWKVKSSPLYSARISG